MMASLIFVISVATLLMFFISYCRSLMASSSRHALSEEVRDVTGISSVATGRDFPRVVQLLQLCPEHQGDRVGLRAVAFYYSLLGFLQKSVAPIVPSLRSWADLEQASCGYFAAVALDRRIAYSRELLTQQSEL
jgi:hypothetical protein